MLLSVQFGTQTLPLRMYTADCCVGALLVQELTYNILDNIHLGRNLIILMLKVVIQ